jgi:histidinol-phosphate aminotransferase
MSGTSERALIEAIVETRVRPLVRSMKAYRGSGVRASVRLDANEAPPLLPTLTPEERRQWDATASAIEPARYPDIRAEALRAAISASIGASPDSIVIGCGSDEVIAMLLATLARTDLATRPVALVPTPTFVMYAVSARLAGFDVVEVPLDAAFDLDEAAMAEAIVANKPAVVFLATPNNPTSGAFERARVERLVELAAQQDPPTLVVIDEAYLAFRRGDGDPWSGATGLDLLARRPNVIVMRTLSKVGLAALRVGWLVATPALAEEIDKTRLPYDLPAASQALATLALGPLSPAIERHVASIVACRGRLLEALAALPFVSFGRADGNFVWLKTEAPAVEVARRLAAHDVAVRAFPAFPDRLRITIGTDEEHRRLLGALAEVGR